MQNKLGETIDFLPLRRVKLLLFMPVHQRFQKLPFPSHRFLLPMRFLTSYKFATATSLSLPIASDVPG